MTTVWNGRSANGPPLPPSLPAIALVFCMIQAVAPIQAADATHPNQFRFNARFMLNAEADFKTLPSTLPPQSNPGPETGGTQDRFYDDGYVRVDSTGNLGGTTGFWGYQAPGQVDATADTLAMHSTLTSLNPDVTGVSDDPGYGGELSYSRQLGVFGGAGWGIEAGLGYVYLRLEDNSSLNAPVTTLTDIYSLGGILPPPAPYSGSFNTADPRIGSTPIRSAVTNLALTTGERVLDSDIYTARLGPYFDIPMGSGLNLRIGGGAAMALVRSEFSIRETTVLGGSTSATFSGHDLEEDFLFGVYAMGLLSYPVSSHWDVFAGAQWSALEDFDQQTGGREAQLELRDLISVDVGMAWSF